MSSPETFVDQPTTSLKTRKERIWQRAESRPAGAGGTALLAALLTTLAAVLRPFGRLRIGLLHHRAQGRFYGGTEYFLRLRRAYPPQHRELLFLVSGSPVNCQVLAMVAREVRVLRSDRLWRILDAARRHMPESDIWIDMGCTGWLRGHEWSGPGPQLHFNADEHARGQALLRRLGIPEGAQYVCIFAKDRCYSDSPDRPPDPDSYWGTRDFRNCDIRNYLPAAQYLADRGIWVLRMGIHTPEEPLPRGLDPKIIDYTARIRPTLDDPEFADTYLQATCKFFVGTTSGIYLLSSIFGVPVAYTNMVPYGESGRMPHDIIIFKRCRDRNSGRWIPIRELIGRGLDSDWLTLEEIETLEADGIEFVENTPDEVLDLVREMDMRLDRRWTADPEDEALLDRFRALSPSQAFDGSGFPGRVGAAWLRENRQLLD